VYYNQQSHSQSYSQSHTRFTFTNNISKFYVHIYVTHFLKKCCCDQKYAVSVECCTQRCYCELVIKVVYDNFQDILVPQGAIQYSREYKKLLKSISIHFNCSTKITSHNTTLSLLGVHAQSYYYVLCELSPDLIYSKKIILHHPSVGPLAHFSTIQ